MPIILVAHQHIIIFSRIYKKYKCIEPPPPMFSSEYTIFSKTAEAATGEVP